MSQIMHVVELPLNEMLTKELLEEAMSYLPPCEPEDTPMVRLLAGKRDSLYSWKYLIEKDGVLFREDKLSNLYGPKLIVKVIEEI